MQRSGLGFFEAALKLELVTEHEAASALQWATQLISDRHGSVHEAEWTEPAESGAVVVRPLAKAKPCEQLLVSLGEGNLRGDKIRALRTDLITLSDETNAGYALALLGPGTGDGRSQLAAELAIAYSLLGRRTLLVDADLRRPRQHMLFCAENAPGLAQALAAGTPPQVLDVEGLPNLALLPAGLPVPNPLELICDPGLRHLLRQWCSEYAYVIIDTPPVTAYADGLAIASLVSRVLVVVRANATSHRDMKEMLRRLAPAITSIVGAVINEF